MEKYDWKSNIKMNITMLRFFGLWPEGDGSYTAGPYLIHAIFLLSFFMIGHLVVQIVQVYFIRTNIEAVIAILFVLLVESMIVFKSYHLITNMRVVKELFGTLHTELFLPKNELQIKAIEENVWFWRLLYKMFLYSVLLLNLFFGLYPLLDKSEGNEKRLPFLAWYPFDATVSPYYEIAYSHQVFSVIVDSVVHANVDSLLAALNTFNASQFDILADNLKNLHKLGGNDVANFIKCVKHHKEILNYSQKSNKFMNWILLVQFCVSAISIGVTLFQLTLVTPMTSEFFSVLAYLSAVMIQIFMYCWFGNEVEVKSNTIPYAVFECDWTNFSEELKRGLLIFTIRVQKPVKLSTLNLFYLSLETFKSILKTSWSYFTLLHQVTSK